MPMITPDRPGSASSSPASASAISATARLNWAKRSTLRASLVENHCSGSKSVTRRSPSGAGPSSPSQNASGPVPTDEITPIPVMATVRPVTGPSGPTAQQHQSLATIRS